MLVSTIIMLVSTMRSLIFYSSFRVKLMKSFFRVCFSVSLAILISSTTLIGCSSKKTGDGDTNGLSEEDLAAQREGRFGSGSIPTAEGEGLFKDIYFEYDSANLSDAARQRVEANVETLKNYPGMKIQLEGHTDERGTAEYNMALGATRAKAVKNVLVSLGVSQSKLETISYGEEVPVDPSKNESAYARNRRVHFSAVGGIPSK